MSDSTGTRVGKRLSGKSSLHMGGYQSKDKGIFEVVVKMLSLAIYTRMV